MSLVCEYCSQTFSRRFTLNRHMSNVHNIQRVVCPKDKWGFKCLEGCDASFQKGLFLVEHLETIHKLKFENETITLANMHGHDNKLRRVDKKYKRNLKSQGLFHINSSCTSQIKVFSDNGSVIVNFQKVHYGHKPELSKIRLPKKEREKIAAKLIHGVPPKQILHTAYDNIGENLRRVDLLTMTDIHNVKLSCSIGLQDGKRHNNDALSVDSAVKENMSKMPDDNPIIYYKKQGDESKMLRKEDFCVIIMNKFQNSMIKKFGKNILTVDGTHGLSSNNFELTTLMILDEYKQGFPVAFMFSNRKDICIYQLFFQYINENLGVIRPKIFMSDMTSDYFNAWVSVMGAGDTRHLFCAWHVNRAWKSNIIKVKRLEKRKEVMGTITILQQNKENQEFEKCLNNTITQLLNDDDTKEFGVYFKNNYELNYRKWAYCFRKDSLINSNMHVEAMHKILEHIYSDKKTIPRLDMGIDRILQFLRDMSRDRIHKLVKGKNTNIIKETLERHRDAQNLNNYTLQFFDGVWKVTNETGITHTIKKNLSVNCCLDICSRCNICRHVYDCTCLDYTDQRSICKHIHYIILHSQTEECLKIEQESANGIEVEVERFCDLDTLNNSKETTESIIKHESANGIEVDVERFCEQLDTLNNSKETTELIIKHESVNGFEVDVERFCDHLATSNDSKETPKIIIKQESANETEVDVERFCDKLDRSKNLKEITEINNMVNNLFSKLQNFEFDRMDASKLEKIHFHLNMVQNLIS